MIRKMSIIAALVFALPLFSIKASMAMGMMVHDAEVQLPVLEGRPAALYFTLMNHGDEEDALLSVEAELAARTEMHQTVQDTGVARMQKIERVTVAAHQTIKFQRGGHHVMLFGLEGVDAGQIVSLTFHFEKQGAVMVDAHSVAAGVTRSNNHGGHHH